MNFWKILLFCLAVTFCSVGGFSARAQNDASVRSMLKLPAGCYPVAYDAAKDAIQTVCRGEPGWMPEGVQHFNGLGSEQIYRNKLMQKRSLRQDLNENVGPGPWFDWYLNELARKRIPRPS